MDQPPPNIPELLAALSTPGGIFFERVGPGEGPGWLGRDYVYPDMSRVQVQQGPCGTVQGSSPGEVLQAAQARFGGGRYRWAGLDAQGKRLTGEVLFSGEPKLIAGVDDPAAVRRPGAGAPQPVFAGAGDDGFGFEGEAHGGDGGDLADEVLIAGWLWSPALNRYVWPHRHIPPPGPPPKRPPFFGAWGQGGGEDDAVTRELRETRQKLDALQAQLAAAPKGSDPGQFLTAWLKEQGEERKAQLERDRQDRIARENRESADRASRETREAEARKEERDSRQKMFELQMATLRSTTPPDPAKAIEGAFAMIERVRQFSGGPEADEPEDDPESAEESGLGVAITNTIGRALDTIQTVVKTRAATGPTRSDTTPPERQLPNEQPVAAATTPTDVDAFVHQQDPPPNGGAQQQPPAPPRPTKEDLAVKQWTDIVRVVHKSMRSGAAPNVALFGLSAFCEDRYDWPKVLDALGAMNADALVVLVDQLSPSAKQALAAPLADFKSEQGHAWLVQFLELAKAEASRGAS